MTIKDLIPIRGGEQFVNTLAGSKCGALTVLTDTDNCPALATLVDC